MIIYASNIHQGGGKVLLEALLSGVKSSTVFFSDSRLELSKPIPDCVQRISVNPTIFSRLKAEIGLRRAVQKNERVLCFGNLPPLLPSAGKADLFFQNTILLKKYTHFSFSWPAKIKHSIERLWLAWGLRHIDTVYVQSASVRDSFSNEFPNAHVVVAPFMVSLEKNKYAREPESFDFIYIASGEPHKNHECLLQAWQILNQEGLRPSLALTIPSHSEKLLSLVKAMQAKGMRISNYGELSHTETLEMLSRSKALIFPSLTESFGLPLLEARALDIPIVASELDYVREFVAPVQSFDPNSARSISLAVKRFLGSKDQAPLQKIYSPEEFLSVIQS